MKRLSMLFSACLMSMFFVTGQNLAVNTDGSVANPNAILDIKAANKGILIPRMDATARLSIPNTKGLLVYDTTSNSFWYNTGTTWLSINAGISAASASDAWLTTGNSNTGADNFIGTTNEAPFNIRVNNIPSGQIEIFKYNTYFGLQAGMPPASGTQEFNTENTIVGAFSLISNISGNLNSGFGIRTLNKNENGSENTAIGADAMFSNTNGRENVGVGFNALYGNTTGAGNTASGSWALFRNTTGGNNTATGTLSMFSNTTGNENTAGGMNALYSNSSGNDNTAYGAHSLYSNTTGTNNVANGAWVLNANTTGIQNTATGAYSQFTSSIGSNNTSNGYQTLRFNTGSDNTAIGASALFNTSTGEQNTATGSGALFTNTTGISNSASGYLALYHNIIGIGNTATGSQALFSNEDGGENVANGYFALYNNNFGDGNCAIGFQACYQNFNGSGNVGIGPQALFHNFRGSANTAIGANADVASNSLSNATAIGSGAIVDASNKVRIGNSAVTVIEGQAPFTTPSDGRFKFDVQEDVKGLDFIMQLRPVTYHFDVKRFDSQLSGKDNGANMASAAAYDEATNIRRSGFIAQEVEKAANKSDYNFSGIIKPKSENDHYSLSYESFVVPLVKAVQEQQKTIADLQQQINELKKLLEHSK